MSQRRNYDDTVFDHEGLVDVAATIEHRAESPTLYEAPGKKRLGALYGLNLMKLSSAAHIVGTALIWHANCYTGRCDPSRGALIRETGLSRNSVIRAIKELERNGILRVQRRRRSGRQISNAHHLNWDKLERKFFHFERLIKDRSVTRNDTAGGGPNLDQMVVPELGGDSPNLGTLTHEGTHEGEPMSLNGTFAKANDASVLGGPLSCGNKQEPRSERKIPKGLQEEPLVEFEKSALTETVAARLEGELWRSGMSEVVMDKLDAEILLEAAGVETTVPGTGLQWLLRRMAS